MCERSMTTDAELITELREVYWMTDMNKRCIRSDVCGEAANRLEQLVIQNRALTEGPREKVKRMLDRLFGPVA